MQITPNYISLMPLFSYKLTFQNCAGGHSVNSVGSQNLSTQITPFLSAHATIWQMNQDKTTIFLAIQFISLLRKQSDSNRTILLTYHNANLFILHSLKTFTMQTYSYSTPSKLSMCQLVIFVSTCILVTKEMRWQSV